MRVSTHPLYVYVVCICILCLCLQVFRASLFFFYLSHASSTRVCTCVRLLFFSPLVLVFFFAFGILGHEGVSRKTRTLEQAEWKQLGSYYTSPRIARRLVAASSYVVHTYIHGLLRKNNVYSKHYSTYILIKSAWRKGIRWHNQICHCHSEVLFLVAIWKEIKKRVGRWNLVI